MVQWGVVDHVTIVLWVLATNLLSLLRLYQYRQFRKISDEQPIDELKIDQSFVRDISSSSENAVIVDTITVMARQLNLQAVAEGIESRAELDYLKSKRCDFFQGYYFSRPQPYAQFLSETGSGLKVKASG